MKYVVIYRTAASAGQQLAKHFPEHQARWARYRDAGTLLMIGPYADRSGALAVFTSREAAEEFVAGDPFVINGLIERSEITEWAEAVIPDQPVGHS